MKKFLTILICKLLRFLGKLIGKGSSKPGQVALKLCPDILSRMQLPQYIIAVTGSNGKTSTVEMIAHILQKNGKKGQKSKIRIILITKNEQKKQIKAQKMQ